MVKVSIDEVFSTMKADSLDAVIETYHLGDTYNPSLPSAR